MSSQPLIFLCAFFSLASSGCPLPGGYFTLFFYCRSTFPFFHASRRPFFLERLSGFRPLMLPGSPFLRLFLPAWASRLCRFSVINRDIFPGWRSTLIGDVLCSPDLPFGNSSCRGLQVRLFTQFRSCPEAYGESLYCLVFSLAFFFGLGFVGRPLDYKAATL